MPTNSYLPRCPHRVVHSYFVMGLKLLLLSLCGLTTATVSLNGQELDYRFVDPASHMQPWPVEEEAEFVFPPVAPQTPRVAVRWQRNISAPEDGPSFSEQINSASEQKSPAQNKLPQPATKKVDKIAEVLNAPNPTTNQVPLEDQSLNTSQGCYQAPPLSSMSVSIALPAGTLPKNAAAQCAYQTPLVSDARLHGGWAGTEFHWSATCLRHRPLYFEEINAERYGYTVSNFFQPVISAGRFFGTIPALPYKMALDRPRDCVYTLGHYRPGSCAPRRWNRLPWQLTAGVVETGFIAGMILLIP